MSKEDFMDRRHKRVKYGTMAQAMKYNADLGKAFDDIMVPVRTFDRIKYEWHPFTFGSKIAAEAYANRMYRSRNISARVVQWKGINPGWHIYVHSGTRAHRCRG